MSIDETKLDLTDVFNSIKVVVDLGPLPSLDGKSPIGHEVQVNFQVQNFNNDKTFWTDSNGLEMQKRVLNYRPTWDLQKNYALSNENVTANFFPINSAMYMKATNSKRSFLVMNDKSQAGSALVPGGFQFLMNRRIPADDWRGMGEWVDEKGDDGFGIRVSSTYFLSLGNGDMNVQRILQ